MSSLAADSFGSILLTAYGAFAVVLVLLVAVFAVLDRVFTRRRAARAERMLAHTVPSPRSRPRS